MGRGKRNSTIVISSSDDEGNGDFVMEPSSDKPKLKLKSRSASVPRKNPKRAKIVPLSGSSSLPRQRTKYSGFDEIKRFCDEIKGGFSELKVSTDRDSSTDLWVDKYKPSLEELAVHKKKVEEVKIWFEERVINRMDRSLNHVLLIAGPAGVGKSTTVHAIASHIGADICEWNTPTPTIWQEHLHHSNSGLRYMSKLDEFESFVERMRKYGILPSSVTARPLAPVLLLIDDLPVVNGKVTYERLKRCLTLLVQSVRIPTAMLFTDHSKADSTDFHMRYPEELLQSLESAGACDFQSNYIQFYEKSLEKICRMEQVNVTADSIEAISKASGGDIRSAITSLQYFCLNQQSMPSQPSSSCYSTPSKESLDDANTSYNQISMTFGRDETISLFHALGKFLHNKRENEDTNSSDKGVFVLKEEFTRFPLKMDVPEVVLSQAHGQARPITDFLHENVLDFLNEEAADDAWVVSSYLSDADFLLSPSKYMIATNFGTENLQHLVAASVAVRGVLFGNNHPSPSRWHAIRRPKLWQVEQSMWQNKCQMSRERGYYYVDYQDQKSMPMQSVIATEIKPTLKWLGHRVHDEFGIEQALEDVKSDYDTSDDDIEDW